MIFTVRTILITFFLVTLFASPTTAAVKKNQETDILAAAGQTYKVLLLSKNSLFSMNPDGSERKQLISREGILDFAALNDGRIFIHSQQYDGDSLEILDPETGVTVLVEFTEGKIPNIALSEDGSVVAYEVKHLPTSTEGDGVWLYQAKAGKTHIKVSGTALSIEALSMYRNHVYILYHEMDLVSDEAGLFIESVPLDGVSKSKKEGIPEGMKTFVKDGYSLGFVYPESGRKLQLKNLDLGTAYETSIPSGDIILDKNGFMPGQNPKLVFSVNIMDFAGNPKYMIYIWDIIKKKTDQLEFKGMSGFKDFNWSPDGNLYLTASYIDPSGNTSSPMLFRVLPDGSIHLVAVEGGQTGFTYPKKNPV